MKLPYHEETNEDFCIHPKAGVDHAINKGDTMLEKVEENIGHIDVGGRIIGSDSPMLVVPETHVSSKCRF